MHTVIKAIMFIKEQDHPIVANQQVLHTTHGILKMNRIIHMYFGVSKDVYG